MFKRWVSDWALGCGQISSFSEHGYEVYKIIGNKDLDKLSSSL